MEKCSTFKGCAINIRYYVIYVISMSYVRIVLLLSFVVSVIFSVEKSHAFQGHFEDHESIVIIDLMEEKVCSSQA